jgi:hypothetical protein
MTAVTLQLAPAAVELALLLLLLLSLELLLLLLLLNLHKLPNFYILFVNFISFSLHFLALALKLARKEI